MTKEFYLLPKGFSFQEFEGRRIFSNESGYYFTLSYRDEKNDKNLTSTQFIPFREATETSTNNAIYKLFEDKVKIAVQKIKEMGGIN